MSDIDADAHLTHRLSLVENDLLEPFADRSSMANFNLKWTTLVDNLKSAIEADTISTTTMSMAHATAHRVSNVMQSFLDLETLSEQLMSCLLLEASSIVDVPPSPPPSDSESFHPSSSSFYTYTQKSPSYIHSACKWLLDNLHNPYPSARLRNTMAVESGSSRKDIDSWFIDARKRIGWNALRKSHFSNKRADIVDAATRFFTNRESLGPVDKFTDVNVEFATIEACARDIYSGRFFRSDLVVRLDTAVKDMTPGMKTQAGKTRRRALVEKEFLPVISSYPSPDRSPTCSTSSLPTTEEDEFESTLSQPIGQSSRKRRASSTDPLNSKFENKRPRIDSLSHTSSATFLTGLPSPASSIHGSPIIHSKVDPSINSLEFVDTSSRKRRLSDADNQDAPRRSHVRRTGTKSQAASNPLPYSSVLLAASEFDGWFNNHIELSSLRDLESDSTAPLEVELYEFEYNSESQPADFVQSSPLMQNYDRLLSITELPDIQPFDLDISTNTFNYDELFSSEEFGILDASQSNNPSHFGHELPSSLGIDFSPHFFDFSETYVQSHAGDHALMVNPSLPISNNPEVGVDWTYPSFSSSYSSVANPNKFQDVINLFHSSTDMANSSLTTHSHSKNPPQFIGLMCKSHASAQAQRAAKQQKLFEIKETARRLEAELAVTPC